MTALERLEKLLDDKDRLIAELEERVRVLTDESERTWEWARHRLLEDDSALPVPRLEIRCRNLGDWWNWEWLYGIVYRHLTGTVVFVPLGHTKVGGDGRPPIRGDGSIRLPFRDGAHIYHDMKQLELPGFAILEDKIEPLTRDSIAEVERKGAL
jgi:hypothetical protein